jgi:hypothetical protein
MSALTDDAKYMYKRSCVIKVQRAHILLLHLIHASFLQYVLVNL